MVTRGEAGVGKGGAGGRVKERTCDETVMERTADHSCATPAAWNTVR